MTIPLRYRLLGAVMADDPQPDPTPTGLLLQAIKTLPPGDRDLVLSWLLNRIAVPASAAVSGEAFWMVPGAQLPASQVAALLAAVPPPRGEQQVVPIRLPVGQHNRLREWCQENGFSMAGVVRGLVDRFLDTVEPPHERI